MYKLLLSPRFITLFPELELHIFDRYVSTHELISRSRQPGIDEVHTLKELGLRLLSRRHRSDSLSSQGPKPMRLIVRPLFSRVSANYSPSLSHVLVLQDLCFLNLVTLKLSRRKTIHNLSYTSIRR